MAVTQTPRLGLTKWGAGSDPFARSQLNLDHDQLETLVAIDLQGTYAARPAAGTRGRYYFATDKLRLYRDDGTAWVDLMDPAGTLLLSATAVLVPGYLWCDGAAYDRVGAYSDLFQALGGTNSPWGLPSGTTFNVPDLRAHAPVGAGARAGYTTRALGARFGTETHVLSTAELAQHSHPNTVSEVARDLNHWHDHPHNHYCNLPEVGDHRHMDDLGYNYAFRHGPVGVDNDNLVNNAAPNRSAGVTFTIHNPAGGHGHDGWSDGANGASTGWPVTDRYNPTHAHGVGIANANAGSNIAHNNVQPSVGVNYMIRT